MPGFIDRHEVLRLLDDGACVVEVLGPKVYAQAHLPGALNLPLAELDRRAPAELPRDRAIVVYCNDFA